MALLNHDLFYGAVAHFRRDGNNDISRKRLPRPPGRDQTRGQERLERRVVERVAKLTVVAIVTTAAAAATVAIVTTAGGVLLPS